MFEKHCQICGIDVKKETATKRFGKYFCNFEHAEQYAAKREEEEQRRAREPRSSGGCC
ncbi:MAG TPA: hypothetical protein VJ771_05580 [Candidatus Nitrosotalea sp.]|nr:hypothetical protein [Candidatus Nitrosotalea sp.]